MIDAFHDSQEKGKLMMLRRIFLSVLISVLAIQGSRAGTIVGTASGTIGGVELVNTGISGGTATIEIDRVPNPFSFVNTVNGVAISPADPVTIEGPITLLVTSVGAGRYSLGLSPPAYTESIGPDASQAVMSFDMRTGVTPSGLPNFFNMTGNILSLISNLNPVYDYSPFAAGGQFNITFTGTTFSGGIKSFDGLFASVGSSIVADGSFSQIAVPEPSSAQLIAYGLPIAILMLWSARKAQESNR